MTPSPAPREENRPLRILHLSVQRVLPAGQRKQLQYEVAATQGIAGVEWSTIALHTGELKEPFEGPIPPPFRKILLRSLYGWIILQRLSCRYDFVLMRHMVFDPFAFLFAPVVANRISVHHAKEVEELTLVRRGISGRIASWMERHSGRFVVRHGAGILGVTKEIANYERETRQSTRPIGVYPNGMDPAVVVLANDARSDDAINAIFICGIFSAWHGLDRLVAAVENAENAPAGLRIHLIGKLTEDQKKLVKDLGDRRKVFVIHGFLNDSAYQYLVDRADLGIGSLAMDRQNLREGATLKVREMLGAGLPVYSGHADTALPTDFPYYLNELPVDIASLADFARRMKEVSRAQVRDAALPFITKSASVQGVIDWISSELRSAGAAPDSAAEAVNPS